MSLETSEKVHLVSIPPHGFRFLTRKDSENKSLDAIRITVSMKQVVTMTMQVDDCAGGIQCPLLLALHPTLHKAFTHILSVGTCVD